MFITPQSQRFSQLASFDFRFRISHFASAHFAHSTSLRASIFAFRVYSIFASKLVRANNFYLPKIIIASNNYSPSRIAAAYSLFNLAIFVTEIPFGHSASHASVLVHAPNPASSCTFNISITRFFASTRPCGNNAY